MDKVDPLFHCSQIGMVFARGYGGQMVYLRPRLELTVVMTPDVDVPRVPGQVFTRHALLIEGILPAFRTA